ncbi:hypothetical protein EJ02DRAFT_8032 [Clathrospora elynae]|uniref:Uncharacterized protein n=1 Tax=Clathrospora elynae TaxID=706981 RepID=A0A6A5TG94_9PLEO|nr:hypothetical protein EJ02DRAFT_8032 [Clathrospora elynae]
MLKIGFIGGRSLLLAQALLDRRLPSTVVPASLDINVVSSISGLNPPGKEPVFGRIYVAVTRMQSSVDLPLAHVAVHQPVAAL